MVAKASTFPSGMKALSDYVHSKGLKLGIYSDAGYIYLYTHTRECYIVDSFFVYLIFSGFLGLLPAAKPCQDHSDMRNKMPKHLPHGYVCIYVCECFI